MLFWRLDYSQAFKLVRFALATASREVDLVRRNVLSMARTVAGRRSSEAYTAFGNENTNIQSNNFYHPIVSNAFTSSISS
jgi:hypothetical protein